LEALSHEELIKLVKRQLLNQKETKKQLEAAKKEAEESRKQAKELATKLGQQQNLANDGSGGESATSMMAIELNDYKNAIGVVRKELQECKEQLAQRDSLVEVLHGFYGVFFMNMDGTFRTHKSLEG
jgi:septal ring factor EnvC (AmiA/AmiB activator)